MSTFTSSFGAYHCDWSSHTWAGMIVLKPERNPLMHLHFHDVIFGVFSLDGNDFLSLMIWYQWMSESNRPVLSSMTSATLEQVGPLGSAGAETRELGGLTGERSVYMYGGVCPGGI